MLASIAIVGWKVVDVIGNTKKSLAGATAITIADLRLRSATAIGDC